MHDPFQNYSTVGNYPGMISPSNFPYTSLQPSSINPMAGVNPAALLGMGGPSQIAQQLQTAAILAGLQNPFLQAAMQNPFINGGLQNPYQQASWGNPLLAIGLGNPFLSGLQNPMLNPIYAGQNPWQQGGLFAQQQHSPYSQGALFAAGWHIGSQYGRHGSPYGQQLDRPMASQVTLWLLRAGLDRAGRLAAGKGSRKGLVKGIRCSSSSACGRIRVPESALGGSEKLPPYELP